MELHNDVHMCTVFLGEGEQPLGEESSLASLPLSSGCSILDCMDSCSLGTILSIFSAANKPSSIRSGAGAH